ncbi:protein FAR1-RELATED SEQUENCE 6-like [Vicia villosa]|uniref:protein FAR1-RELATED SEQUENCE 6-like n=1 Tax=Vicia villosa TaxID=3911 RepID=UPI00273AF220|nr:protein FAR1-RELATED SEQUENCE 6-like [Vicia villosa]XP_058739672.1 protein FAR1-RELATED SEQUENCE 6-like [Vicia villosa]
MEYLKKLRHPLLTSKEPNEDPTEEMQDLITMLQDKKYVFWHRRNGNSDIVKDIFWTHPNAIHLLNQFPFVLVIGCTYKTNRFQFPLLEIVGVTSTELTFTVAFAFLESEQLDNFTWALRKLRGLFLRDDSISQVIVTDKDPVLMNAIEFVFPSSRILLCRFHMSINVRPKCQKTVSPKEKIVNVLEAWSDLINSRNEVEYERRLLHFEVLCADCPIFLEYVKNTWLIPHKEKFVLAWTDRVMHLGNTTTNRVRSIRGTWKSLIQERNGDMCECWDAMNNMFRLQHCAIRASFERSTYMVQHRHNIPVYEKLRGHVSKNALNHIVLEYDRMNSIDIENFICGCKVRKTYGLPCACELVQYSRTGVVAIPLLLVHIHWKRLGLGDKKGKETDKLKEEDLAQEWDALLKRFQELDVVGKIALKSKVRELAFSDTTSMCQAPIVEGEGPFTSGKGTYEEDLAHEWEVLLKQFRELDTVGRIILRSKVHELAFPDTISTCQPQIMEDECLSISSDNPCIGPESVWEGRCHRVAAILRTVFDKQLLLEGSELDKHLTQALCIMQGGSEEGESMEGLAYQRRKKPRSTHD